MEVSRHVISWLHVPGHSGHPDNERCDELAGIERRKLKGEPEKKKSRKRIFQITGAEDAAITEALKKLPPTELERLRKLIAS